MCISPWTLILTVEERWSYWCLPYCWSSYIMIILKSMMFHHKIIFWHGFQDHKIQNLPGKKFMLIFKLMMLTKELIICNALSLFQFLIELRILFKNKWYFACVTKFGLIKMDQFWINNLQYKVLISAYNRVMTIISK